jgi:iron complex transport system substrate-binding protein
MISLAGGQNIAQDVSGWSYTLESLVEADPDIILISEEMKADFVEAENYKDLTAVKNSHIYGINKDLIERQGYRNAEGLRTLAMIIHPEAF